MRIVFYTGHPYWGQLNNTGGCKTIIRSCETLRDLMVKCDIVCQKDKFTWFPHPKPIKKIPKDTDIAIACSVADVDKMLKKLPRGAKPIWWMRGIEKWVMPKKDIIKRAKKLKVIVNATHLQRWLKKYDVESEVVFSGLDFPSKENRFYWKFYDVGFLTHHFHKTKNSKMAKKIVNIADVSYLPLSSKDSYDKLNMERFYAKYKIWLATSQLEGFHLCPAEAALCGCVIVGYNHPHNGTSDYLTPDTGYTFDTVEDAAAIIKNMDTEDAKKKVQAMMRKLIDDIGDRRKNMTRLLEVVS